MELEHPVIIDTRNKLYCRRILVIPASKGMTTMVKAIEEYFRTPNRFRRRK